MFLVRISIKKRAGGRFFFCYLLFPIACFLYTLLPSPRDTLELLGQILIKRSIRCWLNTSLFNFDTHKGLTEKIYIILVCTVMPVGFLLIKNNKKKRVGAKKLSGRGRETWFFFYLAYAVLASLSGLKAFRCEQEVMALSFSHSLALLLHIPLFLSFTAI